MNHSNTSILVIYTGGTIGMVEDAVTGALAPMDFENLENHVPELKKMDCDISSLSFCPLIDSSDMTIDVWMRLAELIQVNYEAYDGFVVLHGTDTMSFSASALSFMLSGLKKPVIFTGSQLPVGMVRTDGKENLITAVEIAGAKMFGEAIVPEVCVYFENHLYRGNRTTKHYSQLFNAFKSHNYPPLAEAGIRIKYNDKVIHLPEESECFSASLKLDNRVALVKLFPGMRSFIKSVLHSDEIKAVVVESYGAGNAPTLDWFKQELEQALDRGIIIVNVSQCPGGRVETGLYETSLYLMNDQILNGYDITTEAALTKLMYLLGNYEDLKEVKRLFSIPLKGEFTVLD